MPFYSHDFLKYFKSVLIHINNLFLMNLNNMHILSNKTILSESKEYAIISFSINIFLIYNKYLIFTFIF